jgi:predicted dehydrogenase
MIKAGIIGYGYWGPNVARNFNDASGSQLVAIADKSAACQRRARQAFPQAKVTADAQEILTSPDIDVVAVVTPVWTHFELAKTALQNGKHVFVEKPLTSNAKQAEELIELAAKKKLQIMVDHTFLFTGAVKKISQLLDEGTLGRLYYYDSTRVNLGLFQHDVNVIWDLAPHDLSIIDHLIKERPEAVVATGQTHLNAHEDVAFITVYFPNKIIAHINVNWLSPVKVRRTLVGGSKQMIVYDDMEPSEKVKVYDKGITISNGPESVYKMLIGYRTGDMYAPQLAMTEALRVEAQHFAECIQEGKRPLTDGYAGLRVVRMLEAATRSMKKQGALVELEPGKVRGCAA